MTLAAPAVALDPTFAGDVARFWRVPAYGGLDCLRATFRRHAYARHTHETFAVAAILDGCETFFHRGAQHYAGPGSIAVVGPEELHDGEPHGGGFEYRTFYPSADLLQEIAEEVTGRCLSGPPRFASSVIDDPDLAGDLARLHACLCLDSTDTPLIERDSRLVAFLAKLVSRWAGFEPAPDRGRETAGIARARAYLEARFAEDVDLPALARVAGLSRTHLIRAFRRETGLTPHAYLVDRRFRAAGRLLERGEAPATVAAECGFFDQSHLNRVFKARMGVTPGAYRAT